MRLGIDVRNAISWFAHALIAGDLGPDDSRYSRDQFFLKHPWVVGQAMAIFLYRLEIGEDGTVLNDEEARERVRQFIEWQEFGGDEPELPFSKEELGIN
jgi:hypothetical protein